MGPGWRYERSIEAKAGNVKAEAGLIRRHHLWRAAPAALWPAAAAGTKRIAVIATEYRLDSHADVIAGRLIKGYEYEGMRREPAVQVVSMYTDQVSPQRSEPGPRCEVRMHDLSDRSPSAHAGGRPTRRG